MNDEVLRIDKDDFESETDDATLIRKIREGARRDPEAVNKRDSVRQLVSQPRCAQSFRISRLCGMYCVVSTAVFLLLLSLLARSCCTGRMDTTPLCR